MAIDLRFLLRRRRDGVNAAPADHLAAELAVHENTATGVNTFRYGHDLDADGVSAVESHKLFEASEGRLWNDTIGASDGSTVFVGDGSALTAISDFTFCQYRNTDTTTNINTASATVIPFGGTTDASDADFTINGSNNRITCNFDGAVSISAHISQSASLAGSNVGIYIAKNGAQISGLGLSGHIQAESGHNESSVHMTATFTVSDGDYIEVFGQQQAVAGTVTQIAGGSQVTVERRA